MPTRSPAPTVVKLLSAGFGLYIYSVHMWCERYLLCETGLLSLPGGEIAVPRPPALVGGPHRSPHAAVCRRRVHELRVTAIVGSDSTQEKSRLAGDLVVAEVAVEALDVCAIQTDKLPCVRVSDI